ncbi:glycoside hydrolase [Hymenobacter sp. BT635]|uniref:Glycoside hydrolase n=1 Tax=Hymenobacter nitidus TaxID=2880929 RepID=A0ABS8AF83_9BACT|nr:glycoside hydrolase [Hymenobacter nitidus]
MVTSQKFARFILVILSSLALGSCEKKEEEAPAPPPAKKYALDVLKGTRQVDTIGHYTHDSVVVRFRYGTRPLPYHQLLFDFETCKGATVPLISSGTNTNRAGRGGTPWRLTSQEGQQQIRVRAYDSLGVVRIDTLLAIQVVRPTGRGWHPAACLPSPAKAFYQYPNGRLLAGLANDFPLYSDDNGQTWQPHPFVSPASTIYKFMAAGPSELLVWADTPLSFDTEIYYSADNGQTWQMRPNAADAPNQEHGAVLYTKAGRLLVGASYNGLFYSDDKGLSWTKAPMPVGAFNVAPFHHLTEDAAGRLYVFDFNSRLYRSTTGGTSWELLGAPSDKGSDLLADPASGALYLTTNYGGIFRSMNQGTTWQQVYQIAETRGDARLISSIFKANGAFYFTTGGQGLVRTLDFTTFTYPTRFADGTVWGGKSEYASFVTSSGALLTGGRRGYLYSPDATYYNLRP